MIDILTHGYAEFLHSQPDQLIRQLQISYADYVQAKQYISGLTTHLGSAFDDGATNYRVSQICVSP